MNRAKQTDWLQIFANVALLAGLVLVGMQIRQNSEMLKTQLLVDEARSWIDGERALLGENAAEVWAKALDAPDELTLSERRVIEAYLYSALESWRSTYMLSELGILDSEWQGRVLEETTYIFGNPYGRAWWEVYRESSTRLPKELVDLIDARLQVNPNWTIEYHDDVWQRAIREHQTAQKSKTE